MVRKLIWRAVLSGFAYEVFYQLAMAFCWITIAEGFSFLTAAIAGIIIAIIIRLKNTQKIFITTLLGLASALEFHLIVTHLDIPLKILFYFDPLMKEIGHTTINENITIMFVTAGYLLISLVIFIITIGVISMISPRLRGSSGVDAVEKNDIDSNNSKYEPRKYS